MMKKLLFLGIAFLLIMGTIPALASDLVTKTYDDITFPSVYTGYWMPHIWDMNACDVTVSYRLDLVLIRK